MNLSPTLCRPQHLDPERLRARLGVNNFKDLRYHEAAVVSTAPMQFQLFALSSDTLFIMPLMGHKKATTDMCISFNNIYAVDRVVPTNRQQRGLLLLPTSQLFRLQLREGNVKNMSNELFFSTFEPQTQLVFQLSRALCVNFQKQLIPPRQLAANRPISIEQRLELSRLLEMFAMDLVRARGNAERVVLLNELAAAASSSKELRHLFFEDRTQIQSCIGLVAYVVDQISSPLRQSESLDMEVEFVLSSMRVLSAMCFDMQLRASFLDILAPNKLVSNLLARGVESYAFDRQSHDDFTTMHRQVLREDFMDAQAALLLALDSMQQYEDFRLRLYQQKCGLLFEQSTSVMQQVLQASALPQWLPKFFKRVCIAISRAAIAIERKHERENGQATDKKKSMSRCKEALDPPRVLALWRNVTVLQLLVKNDVASGTSQVCEVLLRTRNDYIDMYLKAPRFLTALDTSGVPHFEDIALKLRSFLISLQSRPKRRKHDAET